MKTSFPPKLCIVLIIVCFFASQTGLYAQDEMKVGFSDMPPWKMSNDNSVEGADADIIKAIGKKLNLKVTFKKLPFKRSLKYLKTGDADIMTSLLRKPEREEYIIFIDPPYMGKSNKVFYVPRGNKTRISKYEDLYPLKIGTKLGAKYFPRFDSDEKLKKEAAVSYKLNILMLLKKRIDTFIITDSSGDYLIHKMGYGDKFEKAIFGYTKNNPVYIGLSKKSHMANHKSITIISNMIKSGEIDQVISNFFKKLNLPVPDYK